MFHGIGWIQHETTCDAQNVSWKVDQNSTVKVWLIINVFDDLTVAQWSNQKCWSDVVEMTWAASTWHDHGQKAGTAITFSKTMGKKIKSSIFKKESLNMKLKIFTYPHPKVFWNSNILTTLQHPDSLLGFGRQGWHGGSPRRKHLIVFDSKKAFHSNWWIFQYQRNYKFGNPSQFTLQVELFKCRHQIHILLAKALYLFPEWIHLTVKRCEEWMFVQLLHLIHTLGKPTLAAPSRTTSDNYVWAPLAEPGTFDGSSMGERLVQR